MIGRGSSMSTETSLLASVSEIFFSKTSFRSRFLDRLFLSKIWSVMTSVLRTEKLLVSPLLSATSSSLVIAFPFESRSLYLLCDAGAAVSLYFSLNLTVTANGHGALVHPTGFVDGWLTGDWCGPPEAALGLGDRLAAALGLGDRLAAALG